MDRAEFESLRDLPGKVIKESVRFRAKQATRPLRTCRVPILSNGAEVATMYLNYNPDLDRASFVVLKQGIGTICRLDLRGTQHGDAGRTHKHDLRRASCPNRNLPFAAARADLEDASVMEAFTRFCADAHITHLGDFEEPDAQL